MTKAARIYRGISWTPAAAWVAAEIYVSQFDGWGQWAAAPILLVPVLLSAALLITGIIVRRSRSIEPSSVRVINICLLVAGIPVIWFLARAVWTL